MSGTADLSGLVISPESMHKIVSLAVEGGLLSRELDGDHYRAGSVRA
jgi:hypothetical protein